MSRAITIPSIFTAIDRFSAPVRAMGSSVQGFAAKTEVAMARADMAFRRVTAPIRRVTSALGSMGLMLGGAALVGGLISVVGIFKDFEQANANLASVLGKSKAETVALNEDAKRLGATTAFTASQVAGLQTEFAKLGLSQEEILGATEATLALAAATNTELPQAAAQVGSALRGFGLDASEAARVADVFAASTSKSALDMSKLKTGMATVAPVAKAFGFSIEDSVALLGKLSDAGFDASSAATATRNIILNMADSGGKLAKALGRPVNSLEDMIGGMEDLRAKGVDLAKMLDLTDKKSVAAFATFVDGSEGVRQLAGELNNAGGTAQKMAEQQLDTLGGAITILGSAYEGFILSMEDGTGAFSQQIKSIVQVISEMFTLASGSAVASAELSEGAKRIRSYAETGLFLVKAVGYVIGALVLWKATMLVVSGALAVYKGILALVTVAQYAWALAVTIGFGPFMLLIGAIVAAVAVLVIIIKYWEQFGAAILMVGTIIAAFFAPVLGMFGLLVSVIASVWRNWDMIAQGFKDGGILGGLKAIGVTLLDAVLMPLQQILSVAARLPGKMGQLAAEGAKSIEAFRADMGVNVAGGETETPEAVNPEASRQEAMAQRMETVQTQNVSIDVKDSTGRATVESDNDFIPVTVTPTTRF
jgi:TP901 family phage tail tape measure protein